jgi:(R,R)-butanediol dehydrogenase/meso-butanediol dehydrogenase/diacetyl reductase
VKAVVLRGPRQLELMDVPRPVLKDENHVLIQVGACGICGSDLRYWAGENPWALHTLGKHADNPPNMVLGHEFAGVVVQVNSAAFEHLLGQRAGAQAFRVCGECALCTAGCENLCRQTLHIGHAQGWGEMDVYPGAYAEYCLAWADLLHPMPDHVSFEEAGLRDVLGVAVHAVGRSRLHPGATVLCIGGGPVGLCIAQVARTKGAGRVVVSDPSPLARRVIGQFEDLTCVDPTAQTLADALRGEGCAAIFDTVGSAETAQEALPLLAEAGTYVNLAVHDAPLGLNAAILGSERTMTTSSNAHYRDEKEAHALICSGAVDVSAMITHRFPLDEFRQAFDLLLRDPREAYKVVFRIGDSD